MLKFKYTPYILDFKFEAKTSRGIMTQRKIWYIKLTNEKVWGIGEVAPLERISLENEENIISKLQELSLIIPDIEMPNSQEKVFELASNLAQKYPSIRMGLEMAFLDLLHRKNHIWFDSDFIKGEKKIPINGLIWMGDKSIMKKQIDEKIDAGFDCIKLKIGAIAWQDELELLAYIRQKSKQITLRVDANGAFMVNEALFKLQDLEPFDLHSIEQPILPNQYEAMRLICKRSHVPIALDEELINKRFRAEKMEILENIQPKYLVLKPSLLGGFAETKEWITLAEKKNIDWWITSALESNIGLNAISQFTAQYDNISYQGLGTGQLFHNNFRSCAMIDGKYMTYNPRTFDQTPFDL